MPSKARMCEFIGKYGHRTLHYPFLAVGSGRSLRDQDCGLKHVGQDEIPGANWEYGVDLEFLQQICEYWSDCFDWKAQVEKFSTFHHYRYSSENLRIHFIHERGKGPAPIPLILTHGWPGSFLEMMRIIPLVSVTPPRGLRSLFSSSFSSSKRIALPKPNVLE